MVMDRVETGLKELTEEYTRRFAPASPEERFLVETLAVFEWRSRRCLKQLMDAQSKRPQKPASSGLFVVPKLVVTKRPRA